MISITSQVQNQYTTVHHNGPWPVQLIHKFSYDYDANADFFEVYNETSKSIHDLISESLDSDHRLRFYGNNWSMSSIAHCYDRMVMCSPLNRRYDLLMEDLNTANKKHRDDFLFVQGGAQIKTINNHLFARGKSLATSGASNGQTIAGAISTGTHGSSIDIGSIQDLVVGIHLIIGPSENDSVYLERESKKIVSKHFVDQINVKNHISNDRIFNASLVGLGSFGIIAGIMIKSEDIYLLKKYVRKISQKDALDLADRMDFENSDFFINDPKDPSIKNKRPYHYKLYINPYKREDDFIAEIMFKSDYTEDYEDPIPLIKTALFRDASSIIAKLAAQCSGSTKLLVDILKGDIFPKTDEDVIGTLREIFWDTKFLAKAFGCAIGIDNSNSSKCLSIMYSILDQFGPVPGIFSMRFVKQTKALIGFTRFPMTCILEVDGIWENEEDLRKLDLYYKRIIREFKRNNIEFTFHWGKNSFWSYPNLVNSMYNGYENEWKEIRSALLGPEMCDFLSNKFVRDLRLSEYNHIVKNDLFV